ncbi:hypothetical protein FORC44_p007 (plasmid) [Escherichia coli]|nr:hypothetical protein FORC44_p007 [Escherichia coli]
MSSRVRTEIKLLALLAYVPIRYVGTGAQVSFTQVTGHSLGIAGARRILCQV